MNETFQRIKEEIVGILFRDGGTVSAQKLCEHFGVEAVELSSAIEEVRKVLNDVGLEITFSAGGYRLTTHSRVFHALRQFFTDVKDSTLSYQALEVIAIIAYKQPITRLEVEEIRQVNSGSIIKSLLAKRLLRVKGRAKTPGRPFLYVTTNHFLETFGLSSLDELPKVDFREVEVPLARVAE